MNQSSVEELLHEHVLQLSLGQKRQVLDFARALAVARPIGVPGHSLLQFAGHFEEDELSAIDRAIQNACEKVDPDGW